MSEVKQACKVLEELQGGGDSSITIAATYSGIMRTSFTPTSRNPTPGYQEMRISALKSRDGLHSRQFFNILVGFPILRS